MPHEWGKRLMALCRRQMPSDLCATAFNSLLSWTQDCLNLPCLCAIVAVCSFAEFHFSAQHLLLFPSASYLGCWFVCWALLCSMTMVECLCRVEEGLCEASATAGWGGGSTHPIPCPPAHQHGTSQQRPRGRQGNYPRFTLHSQSVMSWHKPTRLEGKAQSLFSLHTYTHNQLCHGTSQQCHRGKQGSQSSVLHS